MTNEEKLDDCALLRRYATECDEAAFAQLVGRYLSLVYGVAMRGTGDRGLAEEISQSAFAILARKARELSRSWRSESLAGWLIKTARLESKKAMRTSYRRSRKIGAFAKQAEIETANAGMDSENEEPWRPLLPYLDNAIAKLSPGDREVITQRYYLELKYREIATLNEKSEDAVRKHVSRAVDRLSGLLRSHYAGASASAVALSAHDRIGQVGSGYLGPVRDQRCPGGSRTDGNPITHRKHHPDHGLHQTNRLCWRPRPPRRVLRRAVGRRQQSPQRD